MSVAPCETFGRWHRWQALEVVTDRRDTSAGHALRVLRCERCGTLSWRWAPVPAGSSSNRQPVEAPSPVERPTPARAIPRPATG